MISWQTLPVVAATLLTSCGTLPDARAPRFNSIAVECEPTASTVAAIRQIVQADAESGFSGTVLVGTSRRVLLAEGVGSPDGGRIDPANRFWIASLGKQFAAAAIMKLASEGKLRLDDGLGTTLPDTPPDKSAITLRQLLSHTSGLGQSYVSEGHIDRETAVRLMLAQPLDGPPGSAFRYSNSNIQLAAAVVEVVSGQTYAEFVNRQLWRPAELRATGFAGDAGASAVVPVPGQLPERLRRRFWGEQGVYSSAPDLYRWYTALSRGQVLQQSLVREMFEPAVKISEGHATLGWFRGRTETGNDYIFLRGNEDFGANALLYAYPARDIIVVVLTHAGQAGEDRSWSRKVLGQIEAQLGL